MSDIAERIAALSPSKRELLLRRFKETQKAGQPDESQSTQESSGSNVTFPALAPDPRRRYSPFPLTYVQQTYWTGRSGHFDLGVCGTNAYMEYEICSADESFLSRFNFAWQRLINHHDMLRAVALPDGQQQVLPKVPPYQIEVLDLRGVSQQLANASLKKIRDRMRFDKPAIDRWPLFEILAQRLDQHDFRLHMRIDTLLIDGASRAILFQQLGQLIASPDSSLAPLECTYRDYALTWEAFHHHDRYRLDKEYWVQRLPALPCAPDLPLAREVRSQTRSQFVVRLIRLLEPKAWHQLKAKAARLGLTPSGLVLAAFAEVLAAWSHSTHFMIGVLGSYRPPVHPQIEQIVGNFNSILLLEVDYSGQNFEARARRIQQQLLTDLEHQCFSGFQVLRELNRLRRSGSKATMPIMFNSVLEHGHPNYHPPPNTAQTADPYHYQVSEIEGEVYIPQVLLLTTMSEGENGALMCKWQSVDDVFPEGMMQEMCAEYCSFLQRLAVDDANSLLPATSEPFTAPQDTIKISAQTVPVNSILNTAENLRSGKPLIAPRNGLELQLSAIWEDVIGVSGPGVTEDFFELGGDSFSVVRLLEQVKRFFGQDLELSDFFQRPTIEHMASLLNQQTAFVSRPTLVGIQTGGVEPPFFCIHPAGGDVVCYLELARCLGKDQPFYALQAPDMNSKSDSSAQIETMATQYIEALSEVESSEPYLLGGWSLGGVVAFEMAQQLRRKGQQVGLVALLDSWAPTVTNKAARFTGPGMSVSSDREDRAFLGVPASESISTSYEAHVQALQRYEPSAYAHQVTLFKAAEQPSQMNPDPTLGWDELAGSVQIQDVPGNHFTIIRAPYVQVLAECLRTCLHDAAIEREV